MVKSKDNQNQAPKGSIDRNSYEPAYIQLVNLIRKQIADGHFPPGSKLPSEAQLCRDYDVSHMTVRRAINVLIDSDIVNTAQGKGTFVKPINLGSVSFPLQEIVDLFKDKERTSVRLLEVNTRLSDPAAAEKLDIEVGERVIYIRRLIYRDRDPVIYHQEYLVCDPTRPIVEAEMEITALEGLFTGGSQSSLKKGKLSIHAAVLDETEASLFDAPKDSPAFRLEHIFYDFDDKPVSWGRFTCNGDLIGFSTTVGIWD